jgi:hypothetical protein
MIYQKSALGIQEIFSSSRSLGIRQRQVLVLIDGKRSTEDLEGFFEKQQLGEILATLEQLGFTQRLNAPLQAWAPGSEIRSATIHALSESAVTLSPAQINTIKQILINGADDYLGIMGRGLKQKIQSAMEFEQLRSSISLWHMALRESKLGRESAGVLMEQINHTIENGMLPEPASELATAH